jgi:hypothetical protein
MFEKYPWKLIFYLCMHCTVRKLANSYVDGISTFVTSSIMKKIQFRKFRKYFFVRLFILSLHPTQNLSSSVNAKDRMSIKASRPTLGKASIFKPKQLDNRKIDK